MLHRLGPLRLSLAAKCELLFGAAVALVIVAAVSLPWLRMRKLTSQLNEQTGEALVSSALDAHVAYRKAQDRPREPEQATAISLPTSTTTTAATTTVADEDAGAGTNAVAGDPQIRPAVASTQPTTAPSVATGYGPAELLLLRDYPAKASNTARRTMRQIERDPDDQRYTKLARQNDESYRYRYGRLVFLENRCAGCHAADTSSKLPVPRNAIGIATVEFPSQVERNELLLNSFYIFLAALFAGTLAVLFFFIIISRLILEPVRVLQRTAEKVSEGDLNIRTHIPSGDEFQVLSETFNKMLENLKTGEDQLRAINKTLDLKIGELSESNVALYESNRLKSEFLANVSHELRTPLNSILGFAELLREAAKTDPKASRYVQNIMGSGRSLLDLINDLLDLAKIEAGKMDVRPVELSLSDMFEGLSSILRPLLEPKGLTVNVNIANDVPLLYTDAAKLQQILYNFMSNAIKFSPAGGRIDLIAKRETAERVRISVADRGPGIEPEKQQLIFEKFRQVDASHTRQYSGTGLGLAISRDLTNLLGGRIGVESEIRRGATFWVDLPIRIEAVTADLRQGEKVGVA